MNQPQVDPSGTNTVAVGIAFMIVATFVLPLMGMTAKFLTFEHVVVQIVWARYTGHFIYMSLLFLPTRGFSLYRSSNWKIQVLRSVLLLGSTLTFFTALKYISLPMATAINFIAPILVTILAATMLKERVGPRRWAAVVVGFAGAMVIIRPGMEGTHWGAGLVLITATCWAMYQVLTRRISGTDSPETTVTYTAMVGCVLLTILMLARPDFWTTPVGTWNIALFFGIGVIAAFGHFLVVKAYEHAPASIVSPFNFLQLIGATLISWIAFREVPDFYTWVGATMIIVSSLYVGYRERKQAA